jgi:glycosyltransferase involved in cell wall biosynthesis
VTSIDISVVAPLYNEEGNVEELAREIVEVMDGTRYSFEIIFVNDGSSDRTWELAEKLAAEDFRIRCIDLAGNFGQTLALRAGFEAATGEVIIAMDGDLQHDPAYIPKFMEYIEQGYDLVGGYKEKSPDSKLKSTLARFAHGLIARISGFDMKYFGGTFKAYRRYLLEEINLLGDMHRFLGAVVARKGIRFKEIPIKIRERGAGESSYNLLKAFLVIVDLVFLKFAITFMNKPFRLFGVAGGILLGLGFLLTAFFSLGSLFFDVYIKEDYLVEFVAAISTMVMGLLFICFGLIAEIGIYTYYTGSNQRPYRVRRMTTDKTGRDG